MVSLMQTGLVTQMIVPPQVLSFFFFFFFFPDTLGIWLLADTPLTLHGFFDADWDGNPDDRTSICAFLFFFGAIQFHGVLQSNALLLVLPPRLSIVQLQLLLSNCNG